MKFIDTVAYWHTASNGTPDRDIIYSFDLDHTLVYPKSGAKFARSASDWRWQTKDTRDLIRRVSKFATIVIFTNQGGVVADKTKKSFQNLEGRIEQVLRDLDLPNVRVYAACKKSVECRKPEIGMWKLLVEDLSVTPRLNRSIFVGDAAGRRGDHSDCDLGFAKKAGLRFLLPEEFEAQVPELEKPVQDEVTKQAEQGAKQESSDEAGACKHTSRSSGLDDNDVALEQESKAKKPKYEQQVDS